VTQKFNPSEPFRLTGGRLKSFLKDSSKLRVIMYYSTCSHREDSNEEDNLRCSSLNSNIQANLIDFEEIADFFQSEHTAFGHIDIRKNDITKVLGYRHDQTSGIGQKTTLALVSEQDVDNKLLKDFNLIPYEVCLEIMSPYSMFQTLSK